MALQKAALSAQKIAAPRDGVITALEIKEGDTYSGVAPLYSLSAAEKPPVLRAYTTQRFALETRGTVKGEWDEQATTVISVGTDGEGQKYVDFDLTAAIQDSHGGLSALIKEGAVKITITSRALTSSTLIEASCLREEDGGAYVYVAQYVDGGLLSGYYTVKKVPVTVIDRGENQVSVSDDLSAYRLIDREDRTLKEGMRVMEQTL